MSRLFPSAALLSLFFLTPVRAQEEETLLYFPNVISGFIGDVVFEDIFILSNDGEEGVQASLLIFTNEGLLDSENVFDIASGELASLSYSTSPTLFRELKHVRGWGALSLPAGSVVHTQHRLSVKNKLRLRIEEAFASANTEAVPLGSRFRVILPDVAVADLHTIAIVNPSQDQEAEIQIEFQQHGPGQLFRHCDQLVTVAPRHRVSRFIEHDLCERAPGIGWPPRQIEMTFSSNRPIAFSAMEFFPDTGGFAALPVEILEN